MTVRSSVPSVIDAVLTLFATAAAAQTDPQGAGIAVVDGDVVGSEEGEYVADEFLQVLGARFTQVSATMDGSRRNESVDVECLARVYEGGDDQPSTRNKVFSLLALVESALEADPSLSGVSNGRAQMAAGELRGGSTADGGRASEVDFTITVVTQLINV